MSTEEIKIFDDGDFIIIKQLRQAEYSKLLKTYSIFALALLSPSSSTTVMPDLADLGPSMGHICQARMALRERVLPLRVAVWEFDGQGYPVFVFYGQVPFTVAGIVYRFVTPDNPFQTVRIMEWFALVMGAYFMYKSCRFLCGSTYASILAGALYASAPYFLINIHARGAFCEVMGQGCIPCTLYFSVRCFYKPKATTIGLSAMAWFLLAGTHLITFAYYALFFFVVTGLITLLQLKRWKRFLATSAGFVFGQILGAYFLAPIALETHLPIKQSMWSPYELNWLTPLTALLAPCSEPPMPFSDFVSMTPNLYTAVGWPVLISFLLVFWYRCFASRDDQNAWSGRMNRTKIWTTALLPAFALAFFATWSPFDFWQHLPKIMHVVQYSYRIMTQCMWIGALLSAFAIALVFKSNLGVRHVALGFLLIGFATSSYLFVPKKSPLTSVGIARSPSLGYGSGVYLYISQPEDAIVGNPTMLRMLEIQPLFSRVHGAITGTVVVPPATDYVQVPALYYPGMLCAMIDGVEVPYINLPSGGRALVGLKVPPGSHKIEVSFVGYRWANWLSLAAGFGLIIIFALFVIEKFAGRNLTFQYRVKSLPPLRHA